MQQWLFDLLRESSWGGQMTYALSISGPLIDTVLKSSFDVLIGRHEALRTRFPIVSGARVQKIDAFRDVQFELVTLPTGSDAETESLARDEVEHFASRAVDVANGSPLRVQLLRLSERNHVLAFTLHHANFDGYSINLMLSELWHLYQALLLDGVPQLNLPSQCADYAIWQQATARQWEDVHAAYWRQRLSGAPRIRLPPDIQSDRAKLGPVASLEVSFGSSLSEQIRTFARGHQTVPGLVILSVYAAIVRHWCNQRDFVVPFVVAARHRVEHRGMIAFLAHYLYLRIQLAGDETPLALLRKVQTEFCAANAHLDFGRIQAQYPEFRLGTFFNSDPGSVALRTQVGSGAREFPLAIRSFPFKVHYGDDRMAGEFGLTWSLDDDGYCVLLSYRADLYSTRMIQAVADELRSLLTKLIEQDCTHAAPIARTE